MKLIFISAQARGAVLVNLEIAGTLFVTNYRLVFLVCLSRLCTFDIMSTCLILRACGWCSDGSYGDLCSSDSQTWFLVTIVLEVRAYWLWNHWRLSGLKSIFSEDLLSSALGCICLTRRSLWMAQGGGAKLPLPLGTIPLLTIENFSKQVRSHFL